MLEVITLSVGQMSANCHIVFDQTGESMIIDPGDDAQFIIAKIEEKDIKPKLVVATHGHFDHVLAVTELKLAYNIPFAMNKKDEFLLKKAPDSVKYFNKIEADPVPSVENYLKDTADVAVGRENLNIIEVPGHTPGSIALYAKSSKLLFVGDTIFAGGYIGRTDFSYSDSRMLEASIKKIMKLPKDTVIKSGHGEDFLLSDFANMLYS